MKKFLKSLNWSAAFFLFFFCGLGAMSRKNEDIQTSLMVWLVFGVPFSILFLFVGRENQK